MRSILNNERMRYLASAIVCAVANNALLIGFAKAGWGLFSLTLLSFASVGSLGYALHVRFTFQDRPCWYSYGRFMTGIAFGIPAAYIVLTILCKMLHLPMTLAAPAATVLMLGYNFLSARLAIVRRLLR